MVISLAKELPDILAEMGDDPPETDDVLHQEVEMYGDPDIIEQYEGPKQAPILRLVGDSDVEVVPIKIRFAVMSLPKPVFGDEGLYDLCDIIESLPADTCVVCGTSMEYADPEADSPEEKSTFVMCLTCEFERRLEEAL